MAGAILPVYRWQIFDNGTIAPGAKAYFYASGTSTPQNTYNNADLAIGHVHANPVVADSEGVLPIIYLLAASYRVLITSSTGTTIFPAQDDIYDLFEVFTATTQTANLIYAGPSSGSPAAPTFRALVGADLPATGAIALADNGLNDFRLTLTTGTPVTTADVTGASAVSIFAAPYKGNRIALYDSSGVPTWYTSSQFSVAVPATTVQMYDVFVIVSGGNPALELLAWSSDTVRATAIVNTVAVGVYTKSGDATRRYLGSFRTAGVSGQTEDSFAKRYLWNYYNRVPRVMRVIEATNSWAYNGVLRQANATATNQLDFVLGVAEVPLEAYIVGNVSGNATMTTAYVAVGIDSTTTAATGSLSSGMATFNTGVPTTVQAQIKTYPAVGRHVAVWLETAAAATTTWYGDNGSDGAQSGIHGTMLG